MKHALKYENPQSLYINMLCVIFNVPLRAVPVLTRLVALADKKGHVKISLEQKRNMAKELNITIDALTKVIKLADPVLIEVYGSLRFQLQPMLTDCHRLAVRFTEYGVSIMDISNAEKKLKPVKTQYDFTDNVMYIDHEPDLGETLHAMDNGIQLVYDASKGGATTNDDDSDLPF